MARGETTAPTEIPLGDKLKDLGGLLFLLTVLFALISLITFDPGDVGGARYPLNEVVRNKAGLVGAHLATFLYKYFGLVAFLVIGLLGFWAASIFFRVTVRHLYLKIVSCFILVMSVCTLASVQGLVGPRLFGLEGAMVGAGGIYGRALEILLVAHVGKAGTILFIGLTTAISAVLATDWLAYRGALWLIERFETPLQKKSIDPEPLPEAPAAAEPAVPGPPPVEIVIERAPRGRPAPPPPEEDPPEEDDPVDLPPPTPAPEPAAPAVATLQASSVIKRPLPYVQPPIDIFDRKVERIHEVSTEEVEQRRRLIEASLKEYGIEASVPKFTIGPTVTTYEMELSAGIRISRVASLANELSMRLMVPNIRIVQLPGRGTVAAEVPNPFPNTVRVREFIEGDNYEKLRTVPLPLLLGKAGTGDTFVHDLAGLPHLLIAGTTGSGKSVCLKSAITSLLISKSPEELKLILIDPKMVELTAFEDIPHLWAPVITDAKKAVHVMDWLVKEMEDRYALFNKLHVTHVNSFNQLGREEVVERLTEAGVEARLIERVPASLPYVVVVIDELADLMHTVGKEVETSIIRICQKARAVGIHLIAATQRPSADVLTGLIKSNMPARISFRVLSHIESMIILDRKGAERLLGKGDMLVYVPGQDAPLRAQCTWVSDEEIRALSKFLKTLGEPQYREEILEIEKTGDYEGTPDDENFDDAVQVVLETKRGSISLLQRKLTIGYQRAARLMETMEKFGIVGPYNGDKPRQVLMDAGTWQKLKESRRAAL
jgi:S-DNA-T family DNA segregation ATPase FtsK/SpoIIIE